MLFSNIQFYSQLSEFIMGRILHYHVFLFIECPIGHFGRNCSNKCSPPNFGYLCGQECQSFCKTCHFIFGCTIPIETEGKSYEFNLVIMRIFSFFQKKTYYLYFLFGFILLENAVSNGRSYHYSIWVFFSVQLFFFVIIFLHIF